MTSGRTIGSPARRSGPMAQAAGRPARALPVAGSPTARRDWLLPFLAAGAACIIGGGLLAAATAYVTTEKTAWATAYLVLVGGVAQIGLGAAAAWLSPAAGRRTGWAAFAGWNLGNAGVLAGQLAGLVALTDVGGALLVIALALVLAGTLARTPVGAAPPADRAAHHPGARDGAGHHPPAAHPGVLLAFRALVVLLGVSIPVGLALAHLGR